MSGSLRLLAIVAIALCWSNAGRGQVDFDAALEEVARLQRQGKSDEAFAYCEEIVAQLQKGEVTSVYRAHYLHRVGQLYLESGRQKSASDTLNQAAVIRQMMKRSRQLRMSAAVEQLDKKKIATIESYALAVGNYGAAVFDSASLINDQARLSAALDRGAEAEEGFNRSRESLGVAMHNLDITLEHLTYLEQVFRRDKKIQEAARIAASRSYFAGYISAAKRLSASVEINQAAIFETDGRYAEARSKYVLGLETAKKNKDFASEAAALNNLGLLAYRLDDFNEAIDWFEKGRKLWEKNGESGPDLARTNVNLALIYQAQGKLAEARTLLADAEGVLRKFPEQKHLQGVHQANRAALLAAEGKHKEAAKLYRQGLVALSETRGAADPDTAEARIGLAQTLSAVGDVQAAAAEMNAARRGLREHIHHVLAYQSRAQQLEFFRNKNAQWFHAALSLGLKGRDIDEVVEKSAEWLLNGKAVAMAVSADRSLRARGSQNAAAGKLLDELLEVRSQISASVRIGQASSGRSLVDREQELSRLLAAEIGSPELEEWTTLDSVRRHLGKAVLVEIARFEAGAGPRNKRSEKYAAWIIPPLGKGNVRIIDLGDAGRIDLLVTRLYEGMEKRLKPAGATVAELRTLVQKPLAELAECLLQPLLPHLEAFEHWVISPDGELCRLPWVALPYRGDFLVRTKTVSYVISGRHIVPPKRQPGPQPPVIFADVDYGASDAPSFDRLPFSAHEGREIKPNLERYIRKLTGTPMSTELITGQAATEERFYKISRPSVLVLSTHAFFRDRPQDADILARCGIAFAGANSYSENNGNGVVFGLELLDRLDLRGTDLVVLSACQTAKGDVHDGEGVKSLQYAFQLAGASSVVGTLWDVPDKFTALLTIDFFKNLAAGDDKATALCKAQRELIDLLTEDHPLLWAGLALTGQWEARRE